MTEPINLNHARKAKARAEAKAKAAENRVAGGEGEAGTGGEEAGVRHVH